MASERESRLLHTYLALTCLDLTIYAIQADFERRHPLPPLVHRVSTERLPVATVHGTLALLCALCQAKPSQISRDTLAYLTRSET